MIASECLKKPGDVARRDSDGAIACMYRSVPHYKGGMNSVRMWWPSTRSSGDDFTMREIDAMPGDWTLLGEVTPLDDLPISFTLPDGQFINKNNLQGRCLVRDSDERDATLDRYCRLTKEAEAKVDTLTARVAELEGLNGKVAEQMEWQRTQRQKYEQWYYDMNAARTKLEAELAQLREQQTLGEELTEEQFAALDATTMIIRANAEGGDINIRERCDFLGPECNPDYRYYIDPRPLPALPSPVEEVPEQKPMDWNEYTRVPADEKILLVNEVGVRAIYKRHTEWVDSVKFYRLPLAALKGEGESQ